MQDLSQISTEDLLRMRNAAQQQPAQRAPGVIRGPQASPDPNEEADNARADRTEARQEAASAWRQLTPEETTQRGLPQGGVFQVNGLGEIKKVADPADGPDPAAEASSRRERLARIDEALANLDALEERVSSSVLGLGVGSIVGQETFRAGEDFMGASGWFNQTANDVAGRIEMVQGDLINQVRQEMQESGAPIGVRGADTEKEASRLAASIANMAQTQDEDTFLEGLERARRYYQRRRQSLIDALGEQIQQEQPPALSGGQGTAPPDDRDATSQQLPDLRPGAGLDYGNSREQQGLAQGVIREDNPVLAGVRDEYAERLRRGENAEQIIRWARSAGIDPSAFSTIQAQVKFRDENPDVPIEQYDTTQLDDRIVPLSAFDNAVNQAAQSPLGTFFVNAGNAASGWTLDNIVGMTGGSAERARIGMNALAERNPGSALAGTVTGGVLAALSGEGALGAAGMRAGIPRAFAADTAYGTVAGAGAADDGDRLSGAAQGAVMAGAGSLAGSALGRGLQNTAKGTRNADVTTLRAEGVNAMTVGQTYGGSGRVGEAIKGVEDRIAGIPVIGDAVNAQRNEGLRQFNQAAFRKALEPIGGDVGDKVGQEAIEEAQNQVSAAFTRALAGKGATADDEFAKSLAKSVGGVEAIPRIGEEVKLQLREVFDAYKGETVLSGEALDDISRSIRNIKSGYRNDPLFTTVSNRLDAVERSIFDLFDRQASGTIPEYMEARRAYRRLSVLEDAALRAQNAPDNIFTPAQLGRADKGNTKKFGGKRAAARGDTPFNELQQAGQAVLPNRVPDSGTAGRLVLPLLAVGAGGGSDAAGFTNGAGLTIGAILGMAYTKQGRRLLTKPSRGMQPGTVRRAITESPRTTRALSAIAASGGVVGGSGQQ